MTQMTPLRATLKSLGLSQGDLARALGVRPETVSGWATGRLPLPPYARHWLDQRRRTYLRTPRQRKDAAR